MSWTTFQGNKFLTGEHLTNSSRVVVNLLWNSAFCVSTHAKGDPQGKIWSLPPPKILYCPLGKFLAINNEPITSIYLWSHHKLSQSVSAARSHNKKCVVWSHFLFKSLPCGAWGGNDSTGNKAHIKWSLHSDSPKLWQVNSNRPWFICQIKEICLAIRIIGNNCIVFKSQMCYWHGGRQMNEARGNKDNWHYLRRTERPELCLTRRNFLHYKLIRFFLEGKSQKQLYFLFIDLVSRLKPHRSHQPHFQLQDFSCFQ